MILGLTFVPTILLILGLACSGLYALTYLIGRRITMQNRRKMRRQKP